MATAAVFGSTGAVGRHILTTLLTTDSISSIKTISRRLPQTQSPKLEAIQEAESSKWASMIANLDPKPSIVINAVGTTKAAAGGVANQWKIDHDLCIDIAKAAKEAGVKTFVFISSAGTRSTLFGGVPYSKMKVGVEDAIKELNFEQAIIMRPGMILGERETPKAPFWENLIGNIHKISPGLQDAIGQDQVIIGRATVAALRLAQEGKAPSKYWVVEKPDICKFGRDEWTG
ncbi:hypothetical protein PRZ48_004564 [Zasmidium cellare]|uniref:NAD(P)-binding domain-containing protein n=1 Tax=Zasmidium cellare TaxID=395010 RepID=A0ABR0EPZ1_ZASCE|nr:hypothetical protein PRZ48_004564 [Zasmidium cellare]